MVFISTSCRKSLNPVLINVVITLFTTNIINLFIKEEEEHLLTASLSQDSVQLAIRRVVSNVRDKRERGQLIVTAAVAWKVDYQRGEVGSERCGEGMNERHRVGRCSRCE